MNTNQTEALIGMAVVLSALVLLVLPSLIGAAHDRRVDRQNREAQEAGERQERERTQKSSSRSTVPSTATWYAEGRRSKKLVSS